MPPANNGGQMFKRSKNGFDTNLSPILASMDGAAAKSRLPEGLALSENDASQLYALATARSS
jgi:hypothetical protein